MKKKYRIVPLSSTRDPKKEEYWYLEERIFWFYWRPIEFGNREEVKEALKRLTI